MNEINNSMALGGFFVNIITMIIAITSSWISYLVYKENSSPDIIVYLEQDDQTRVILNLVIKNIGKSAARDIAFKTSKSLPSKAFNEDNIQDMNQGPLISGIPFLAPGSSRTLMLGNYAGLTKWLGDEKIKVESLFYKANSKQLLVKKIKNISYLDIYSFTGVSAADNSTGTKIQQSLNKIEKAILSKK
ncbi:hypothetical protein [Pantoea endophytica]|uniref:hypothetical protein n=1 Tax=Pantoea endophytica TaxID=92488 RepID=UPI001FD81FB4|nr:hypothetical protein [Pantoea endophytica]